MQSRSIRHEYIYFVLPKIIEADAEYKMEALSIGLESSRRTVPVVPKEENKELLNGSINESMRSKFTR